MSLIQEALRRQQEEKEAANQQEATSLTDAAASPLEEKPAAEPDAQTPPATAARKLSLPARPSIPSDRANEEEAAPETPAVEPLRRRSSTEKEHRILLPLLGALLVLVLLGGLAAWALLYGFRSFSRSDERLAPVTGDTPTAPAPTEPLTDAAMEQAIAEIQQSEPEQNPAIETAEAASDSLDPTPEADSAAADATATQPEPVAPMAVTQPPPATPRVDAAPTPTKPTPPPAPIVWPEVQVSGVIGAGNGGSAIINGKVVGLNESIENLTVRDFGRGFVVLEFQGETRRFSVGRPIR